MAQNTDERYRFYFDLRWRGGESLGTVWVEDTCPFQARNHLREWWSFGNPEITLVATEPVPVTIPA